MRYSWHCHPSGTHWKIKESKKRHAFGLSQKTIRPVEQALQWYQLNATLRHGTKTLWKKAERVGICMTTIRSPNCSAFDWLVSRGKFWRLSRDPISYSTERKSANAGVKNSQVVNYHIYPTPPLGQDMTQGQFLSGVYQVWIQSFPSPRLVASPRLKNLVCPTIYP